MKFEQVWNDDNKEYFIKLIENEFNCFTTNALIEGEAALIYKLIDCKLTPLLNCEARYTDIEYGKKWLSRYIVTNIIQIVTETRNSIKSLSKDLGVIHRREKFNPLDNADIDNAPEAVDRTTFSYAESFKANIQFLLSNCKALNILFKTIAYDCVITR